MSKYYHPKAIKRGIIYAMYNWSTNTKKLRSDRTKFDIWRLESLINFGLDKEKINTKSLTKYLPKLVIDHDKRKYLEFLMEQE